MAKLQLPKLVMRVRFPLPAPKESRHLCACFLLAHGNVDEDPPEVCGCRLSYVSHSLPGNALRLKFSLCELPELAQSARWRFDSRPHVPAFFWHMAKASPHIKIKSLIR